MNKKISVVISTIAIVSMLSVFVYALTLISEKQVAICYDYDGLNVSKASSTVYSGLNDSDWGIMYDYCQNNETLIEYGCRYSGNNTYFQTWSHNCTCLNGKCN